MALSNFFGRATGAVMVGALAATLSVATSQSAQATAVPIPDTFTTYQFTGVCDDCYLSEPTPGQGIGNATLVLKNFSGGAFNLSNFVSFSYQSILLSYNSTVPGESVDSATGAIPGANGGPGDIVLDFSNTGGTTTHFQASSETSQIISLETGLPLVLQSWCIGPTAESCFPGKDYGFAYTLNAVAAPEPASLALLGAGLFGLGAARRRRG